METNEDLNRIYQNSCDSTKAFLKGKFIVINTNIERKEIPLMCNLTVYIKK